MTKDSIEIVFEQCEDEWWGPYQIHRDRRITPRDDHLAYLPDALRIRLLRNKVTANRSWNTEQLEWVRDNTTDVFIVNERSILFASLDDLTLFTLKFEGKK